MTGDVAQPQPRLSGLASASGAVLALSYPILALSTGTRALYQLAFKAGEVDHSAALLSALAGSCYAVATVGFAVRRRWAWWVSVAVLVFETFMTLAIGTLSIVRPELVGRTVWRLYGIDYGFFPLIQPILGLIWLFWPETVRAFGIGDPGARGQGTAREESEL